jgi:predicted enzyme related to lactoylglutathione lyase
MNNGVMLIVYPVKDLAKAKVIYKDVLGKDPYVDGAYYVGFKLGDQEIGLDPNGFKNGASGPLCYYQVDDIRSSLKSLQQAGAQMNQDVRDVGGGMLIASVKDADGNVIALRQNSK